MDYMKDLETLCDILSDQLGEITRKAKNGMSSGDLDTIEKLTHSIASIKKIMAFMEDEGYSGMDGTYRGAYRGSYARKRDRMGRYSGERGYSRSDLADKMHELMMNAPDDHTRQEMQRLIDKL